MYKIILSLLFVFAFSNAVNLFAQEDPKELFEKSWTTTDDNEKLQLREKILEVSPESEYGLFCKAWFLVQKDDYNSALEHLNKAIALNEKFWQAYHTRANVHGMLKDNAKVISDLTVVIALNPDYGDAYYVRGATYYSTGEKKKGCEDLSKASALGISKAKDLMEKLCK